MRIRQIAALTGIVLTVSAVAAATTYAASPPLRKYFNGFNKNTNGWYETVERVKSGTSGYEYANGISAARGKWYARPCQGCSPLTDWGTGFEATSFPAHGFSTSLDIYLDTSYAIAHPDARFDWDTGLRGSAGEFLQDYVFNAGTSPSGWSGGSGFVVNASTNAGRENSYPENPCPSPADASDGGYAPNVCRAPVTITTSGWYRFVHRFFNDNGYVGVEMSIIDKASATVVPGADWTIVGSGPQTEYKGPEPVGDAGGPDYGLFANEEIPGLPIDDASARRNR
ncbi:MAG TPA: hypothetical protein VNV44_15205 [Solirubrobacteraceae bacterium]|jgi:hypothetical protein|nr:hypothetical protein [Solirubrobacteraceae bacterium]